MKKLLYFILIATELFIGSLLLSSLWMSNLTITCTCVVAAVVLLTILELVLLAKAKDVVAKRKIMRNIALIMLIPTVVFFVAYVVIAVMFIIAFA